MNTSPRNVLFLCTGNSCRSIIAEVLLNDAGRGRFRAYSAGSHPTGAVHPQALAVLERHGHTVAGMRSKSWDEFTDPQSPSMDLVITVCDRAASETCPVWPNSPTTMHWSFPDPAAFRGTEEETVAHFEQVYQDIAQAITTLLVE